MNSQQIKYILAVNECRSFSKAAKKLFVTQPSLSQYIITTEQKLGYAIFDRSTSPVSLTPEGEILVEYAKKIYALEQELESRLSECSKGVLRIASEVTPLPETAENALTEYRETVGEAAVTTGQQDGGELAAKLKDCLLDGIVTVKHPHDPELETTPLNVWLSVRKSGNRSYSDQIFWEIAKKVIDEE